MRIGLFSPAWPGDLAANGLVTSVANLHAGLKAIGHDPVVFAWSCEEGAGAVSLAPVPRSSLTTRVINRLRPREAFARMYGGHLAAVVKRSDAVRGLDAFLIDESFGMPRFVQRRLHVPVIAALHGPWFLHGAMNSHDQESESDRLRIAMEGEGLRACAGITAPSQDVLARTIERYGLPASIPRAVIPNSIVSPQAMDPESLTASERRSLLFVGRFDQVKGGDLVLEAFARLVAEGADARLTLVGPDSGVFIGDRRVGVREAINAMPPEASARVTWLGKLPRAEVEQLRRRHWITIVASRYETFCYTLLEAMAIGAPTVAPLAGGMPELGRDRETGLFVPPNDSRALADACRELLDDDALARSLGAKARRHVERTYAPEIVARELITFVEQVKARFTSA